MVTGHFPYTGETAASIMAKAIAEQCSLPVVMLTAYSERDLVQRAADVHLKERRPLVLQVHAGDLESHHLLREVG